MQNSTNLRKKAPSYRTKIKRIKAKDGKDIKYSQRISEPKGEEASWRWTPPRRPTVGGSRPAHHEHTASLGNCTTRWTRRPAGQISTPPRRPARSPFLSAFASASTSTTATDGVGSSPAHHAHTASLGKCSIRWTRRPAGQSSTPPRRPARSPFLSASASASPSPSRKSLLPHVAFMTVVLYL